MENRTKAHEYSRTGEADPPAPPWPSRLWLVDEDVVRNIPEALDLCVGVLEALTDYSIVARDLDGRILLWNEGARRIYGYDAHEMLGGANWHLLQTPEDMKLDLHSTIMNAARRDGRWEGTVQRLRKDGARLAANVLVTLRYDDQDNVVGFLFLTKDVSEEFRLAEELRASRFQARSLFESALDALVMIDAGGKITDLNRAFTELTGIARENMLSTGFSDYFTEPAGARDGYQRTFSEGFVRDFPLAVRHVAGSVTDVLFNASVYKDGKGGVLGVFGAARDVTERKRFELSLLEANRMKSDFLAGMSHELRTPLNGIIGYTEFLVDEKPGPLMPKQKEYLNDVLSNAGHLLQLINDVLDLAKVEAGNMQLCSEIFPVDKAVADVVAIVNGSAGKKCIVIGSEVGDGLDAVLLDRHKFRQVLYNLLSNAIKFIDWDGRVDVAVRRVPAEEKSGGEDRLELCVRDTGIGIRPEDMERIFAEFEQLDSGLARRFEGAGLGLSLTKRIVEFQGGSITVASQPGKGSTFTVILPIPRQGESDK